MLFFNALHANILSSDMSGIKLRTSHAFAVLTPVLAGLGAYLQPFVEPRLLFLDPLVAAMMAEVCCKTYLGILSVIGVILWFVTAAICLFAAKILHAQSADRRLIEFAVLAGLVTAWLAVDDAFLFHENIAPKLGVPQELVLAFIAALAIVYVARCWRVILASDALMFALSGTFLVVSLGVDVLHQSTSDLHFVIEDGAKFTGIVCWAWFHIHAMVQLCRSQARLAGQAV